MPYCTNCGEEVTDEQHYCSYCGEPLDDVSRDAGGPDGYEQSQSTESEGFEGDPPPEGYEDPPGVGTAEPTRSPAPGAVDLFGSSVRTAFGFPLLLAGLFVAWIAFFLVYFFAPPPLSLAAAFTGVFGLFVAGMIYVGTEHDRDGEPSSVGVQAQQVLGVFPPLVGIWLLFVIPFGLGLTVLLLPGLYVGSRLFLAFPACVLDGEGVFDSLSTSWELTSGISLKTLGLLVLASLSVVVLVLVLSVVTSGVLFAAGADLPADPGAPPAETAEDLDLTDYPALLVGASISYAVSLAIVVGAVQVAAARLYLTLRYPDAESPPR